MFRRVFLVASIAFGSLLVAACEGSSSIAAAPGGAAPRPNAPASPAMTRTPSGIFISTRVRPTSAPAISTATPESNSTTMIVQGRVYDAASSQRLSNATIEWQFLMPDRQRYDGQLQVPPDGLYRLELPVRSDDEVIFTARAPGYLPSTARLLSTQLNRYGSRLHFGLVKADGPVPTLPGALGTIQLSGIVYNAARGFKDPIADARVTIVERSVIQSAGPLEATTCITGTFTLPVTLHSSDQIDVMIAASGYQTATLTRSATELARKPQLSIGLKPALKP